MTYNGFPSRDAQPGNGSHCNGESLGAPEIIKHLTVALVAHVRRLHQDACPVPREVEELAGFLMCLVRMRHGPSTLADVPGTAQYARMPDRLLVSKGEAAERLGVSVRTIERLVATGRLRQVHIERLARFRVSDLEGYVKTLAGSAETDPENPSQ